MNAKFDNPNAIQSISNIYLDSDLADVHFTFPNDDDPIARNVPAHKVILAAASPVFKTMFYGPLKEGDIVSITDSYASAFQEFLQFFYLSKMSLSIGHIEEVIRLVDKYDMNDYFQNCSLEKELLETELTSENMVWVYQLALSLNYATLKEFCEQKIQENAADLLKSTPFLQCERAIVENILKLETLNCSEMDLFDACIAWAKLSCEKNGLIASDSRNLKDQLGPCFYLIRFGAMSGKEACEILLDEIYKNMFNHEELIEIMQMTHKTRFQSKLFKSEPRLKFQTESICRRNVDESNSINFLCFTLQEQEMTLFSVNQPLALKQIQFDIKLFDEKSSNQVQMGPSMLQIFEYDGISSYPSGIPKNIYNYSVAKGQCVKNFALHVPIPMRPQKLYKIYLEYDTKGLEYSYKCPPWKAEVHLDHQTTENSRKVTIHSSLYRGMVSCLVFNPIN